MNKYKVLYGHKDNEPEYMEDIITEHEDRFDTAKEWAMGQGYTSFRIAEIDPNTPPDFTGAITK